MVHFNYELVGTGWARASIGDGNSKVQLTASYLGDALGDLLHAISTLLTGGSSARCSWEEEPGEYRWIFLRDGTEVDLAILALPDNMPPLSDEDGEEIFRTVEPLERLATSIVDAAQRVLDEYGEDEYLRRWDRAPFPTENLRAIRELLANRA